MDQELLFSGELEYTATLWSVLVTGFGLVAYWLISHSPAILSYLQQKWDKLEPTLVQVVFMRINGFIFYLLIPTLVVIQTLPYSLSEYGLNFQEPLLNLYWIVGLSILVFLLQLKAASKESNTKMYPQIRINTWGFKLLTINTLGWLVYLFSYEFLIRGILLFGCFYELGAWPAIVINTVIYSLAHVPKSAREAIGAVPLGILLCMITLTTGNIWVAFVVHAMLALCNDYIAISASSEMEYRLGSAKS